MTKQQKILSAFEVVKDEAPMILHDLDLFPAGASPRDLPFQIQKITGTWKTPREFHLQVTVGHVEVLDQDEYPVNGLRPHKGARQLGRALAQAMGANPKAVHQEFHRDETHSTEIPVLEKMSSKKDKGLYSTTYDISIKEEEFSTPVIHRILREKELADLIREQLHATMRHTTPLTQFGIGDGRTPLLFLFDSHEAAQQEIRSLRLDVTNAGFTGDLDAFIPEQPEEVVVKGVGKKWELGVHVRGQQEGLEALEKVLSARLKHKNGLDTDPSGKAKIALINLLLDMGIKLNHTAEKAAVRIDPSGDIAVQLLLPPPDDRAAYQRRLSVLKEKLGAAIGDLAEIKNGSQTLTLHKTSDMGQVQYLLRLANQLKDLRAQVEGEYHPQVCAALTTLCRTAGFVPMRREGDETFVDHENKIEFAIPIRKITDAQKETFLRTVEEASSRMKRRLRMETTGGMTAIYLSRLSIPKTPQEKPDTMGYDDMLDALKEAAQRMPSLNQGGRQFGGTSDKD